MAWINSMMALVSSDELANDVTGAEALLERHQVIKQYLSICDSNREKLIKNLSKVFSYFPKIFKIKCNEKVDRFDLDIINNVLYLHQQ